MAKKPRHRQSKPGRPKGTPNQPRETVVCIPPACPRCGRTVKVNLRTVPTRVQEHSGTLPDGTPYTRMEWRRLKCECGQGLSVRTPRS